MSDLVERLRRVIRLTDIYPEEAAAINDAIDALSLIEAERDKLREALVKARVALASELDTRGEEFDPDYHEPIAPVLPIIDAALHPTDNDHGDGR